MFEGENFLAAILNERVIVIKFEPIQVSVLDHAGVALFQIGNGTLFGPAAVHVLHFCEICSVMQATESCGTL